MGSRFVKQFLIGERPVGDGCPVYVIAEAGVAHFGSEEKALRLVDLALAGGADAVKFQIFDVNALIAPELPGWRERLGSRQLPYEAFERIRAHCASQGIQFLATAHDEPSLDFLSSLEVPAYKVGSGEVGNWPFLKRIASLGRPVIVSTGMYAAEQVGEALEILAESGRQDVAILHCVTRYPTPPDAAALGNIAFLRDRFDAIVGYSDHTRGFHVPLAAVALGAKIVEKHITLDFDVPDAQDWKVSCGPGDLALFISQLREVEASLGDKSAGPSQAEDDSKVWATKSLVTARSIRAGTTVAQSDFTAKRPGTGVPPSRMSDVVGRKASVDLQADTVLRWEHLE